MGRRPGGGVSVSIFVFLCRALAWETWRGSCRSRAKRQDNSARSCDADCRGERCRPAPALAKSVISSRRESYGSAAKDPRLRGRSWCRRDWCVAFVATIDAVAALWSLQPEGVENRSGDGTRFHLGKLFTVWHPQFQLSASATAFSCRNLAEAAARTWLARVLSSQRPELGRCIRSCSTDAGAQCSCTSVISHR
jgi:hypothetical protein